MMMKNIWMMNLSGTLKMMKNYLSHLFTRSRRLRLSTVHTAVVAVVMVRPPVATCIRPCPTLKPHKSC